MIDGGARTRLPAVARRERYGTWKGSVLVFGFVCLWEGFWLGWDALVPGREEVAAGQRVKVSQSVSFTPAHAWSLSRDRTTPGTQATVTRRSSAFTVRLSPWTERLDAKIAQERRILKKTSRARVFGGDQSFQTGGGLSGVRFYYSGVRGEGLVWMGWEPSARTVVTVRAGSPHGTLQRHLPDFRQMVDSVRIGATT
ncbi:hypothetical protein [Actinocorallia sp. A-T 12471]|uniref:hypothetical protein n=1 Tax=Actinocorallia sp. A-T 12471 TaxID=3089813 RepID=UPI0029CE2AF1|nr:hypothetical protein [Actinocorallia sp. A-T 12471]MDX6739146.1 hypothetical protein [Actinocorallia sp. A-T 12471]